MSLAYLRLEIFSQTRQIKDHAQSALENLAQDPFQIPEAICGMKMYKQLRVLAGRQKPDRDSGMWLLTMYQRMWDRAVCTWIAYLSGVFVVAIPFVRVQQTEEWFRTSLFLTMVMVLSLGLEMFFVLYGSRVARKSIKLIEHNATELTKAIQASIPDSKVGTSI